MLHSVLHRIVRCTRCRTSDRPNVCALRCMRHLVLFPHAVGTWLPNRCAMSCAAASIAPFILSADADGEADVCLSASTAAHCAKLTLQPATSAPGTCAQTQAGPKTGHICAGTHLCGEHGCDVSVESLHGRSTKSRMRV